MNEFSDNINLHLFFLLMVVMDKRGEHQLHADAFIRLKSEAHQSCSSCSFNNQFKRKDPFQQNDMQMEELFGSCFTELRCSWTNTPVKLGPITRCELQGPQHRVGTGAVHMMAVTGGWQWESRGKLRIFCHSSGAIRCATRSINQL